MQDYCPEPAMLVQVMLTIEATAETGVFGLWPSVHAVLGFLGQLTSRNLARTGLITLRSESVCCRKT
jgi:hypothetical protein